MPLMQPYRLNCANPNGSRCPNSFVTEPSRQGMDVHATQNSLDECDECIGVCIRADFIPRTKLEQREMISRARAQELSIRYELSEFNATSLIKAATFPLAKNVTRGTPSLMSNMTTKQATAQFARNESRKQSKAQTDPLLTESERLSQQHKENVHKRIAQLNAQFSPASQLSRAPFGLVLPSQSQVANTHLGTATSTFQPQLCDTKKALFRTLCLTEVSKSGFAHKASYPTTPAQHSVASTFIETPSPIVYRASNGKRYEVSNMC